MEKSHDLEDCDHWHDANHVFFQLANLCFVASFLIPSSLKLHWLLLRLLAGAGCGFTSLWGFHIICQQDVFSWYLTNSTINALYMIWSLYRLYPAQFDSKLEDIYVKLFKPFKISREEFKILVVPVRIIALEEGATYSQEGITRIGDMFSILITGR